VTGADDPPPRTLPVTPTVHVESFASHDTLTWQGDSLAAFLGALDEVPAVDPDAPAEVDATDAAGRERRSLGAVTPRGAVRYVRVEPTAPWTAAWERRTTPTVSVSGAPPAAVCRTLHLGTTDCAGWPPAAADAMASLTGSGNDGV